MSLRRQVIDTLFGGNRDPLTRIVKRAGGSGTPNASLTAPIGTFCCIDYNGQVTDDDIYINTDGATAWSLVYDASEKGHLYTAY